MRIPFLIPLPLCFVLAGCTDTGIAHFRSYGSSGRITCYSGGRLVLDDFSTGKVMNAQKSDGYEFNSSTTHRLQQVSGDCQVDYGANVPSGWKATLPGLHADPHVAP